MAKYRAKNLKETVRILKLIQKRNTEFIEQISSELPRVMVNAGQIIEARAKEILTEKGHVVTGNLRRSINTQIVEAQEMSVRVEVGTFVDYAIYVEALPDGGFLFPASEETFPVVTQFLFERGIRPQVVRWGRQ